MAKKILVAVLCAMTVAAAGCASSTTAKTSGSSGPSGASHAAHAPQGSPVLLGWINQDAPGAVPTYTGTTQALAAVRYVNGQLGGINGHPLQLVTCSTNGSPESSQTCANTLIAKGIKVVTKNFDGGWDSIIATLQSAGITVLGGEPTAGGEYAATNAFYYIGGAATSVPAIAKLTVTTLKARKVVVLTTSNPIAKSALPLLSGPLHAANITPTVVTAPDDAADFSPFAAAVKQANPDVLDALLTPPQCLPVMKALQSIGFSKPVVTTGLCDDPKILTAAGSAANNWSFAVGLPDFLVSPQAAPSVLYRNVWKHYGTGALEPNAVSQLGALDIVTIARDLNAVPAGVLSTGTAAQLQAAIRTVMTTARSTDPVLGTALRCGQSKILPAVCGFSVYFTGQRDGHLIDVTNGTPIDGFIG